MQKPQVGHAAQLDQGFLRGRGIGLRLGQGGQVRTEGFLLLGGQPRAKDEIAVRRAGVAQHAHRVAVGEKRAPFRHGVPGKFHHQHRGVGLVGKAHGVGDQVQLLLHRHEHGPARTLLIFGEEVVFLWRNGIVYAVVGHRLSQAREKDHRVLNQSAGVLQGVYQLRGLPHRVVVLGKLHRGRHQLHLLHAGAGENIRRLGADALNLLAELGGQLRNAVPVLALQILPGLFLQLIGNGHAHRVQGKGKNQKQHQKPPGQAVAQHGSPVFFSLHASCPSSLSRPVAERRLLRRICTGFIVSWMRLFFIHPRARWAALRKKNARAVKHAAREAVSGKGKHAGGLVQRQNVLPRQIPAIPAV